MLLNLAPVLAEGGRAAFSSLATCADVEPDRKERNGSEVCDAAADFAHAAREKIRRYEERLLIIHEVSSNFVTASCLDPDGCPRTLNPGTQQFPTQILYFVEFQQDFLRNVPLL